jgi:hypothetical protein
MKIRIGALEIEVDTTEQLDELVMRYGGAVVAAADSSAPRAAAGNAGAPPTASAVSDGVPTNLADPDRKPRGRVS